MSVTGISRGCACFVVYCPFMKLFLLKRNISQYTFPDILLGCFTSLEKAQDARRGYLAQYQLGKKIDAWKEQGYKTVILEDDVEIVDSLPVFDFQDTDKSIYVVDMYSEFLGQVVREFIALCGTQESAEVKLNIARAESLDQFPEFFKIEKILLDILYSDDNLQDGYWWK
jgi:hypothetical protein